MSTRYLLALLGLTLVGCVQSAATTCDDGRTCPPDTACDMVHDLCVDPDQLTSCGARGDGEPCTIRATDDGVCDQGVCLAKRCGDGYRRDNEACDGNDIPAEADCRRLGFYFSGAPTCNDACSFDTNPATTACTGYCGDGAMTPGIEVCETDVALTASCVDQGYGTGVLECVDCRPDTRACISFGWQFDDTAGVPEDVHGTAADDVWAVFRDAAYNYRLEHFDGATWTAADLSGCNLPVGEIDTLYLVFTPTKGVVFAAGNSTLIRVANGVCTKFAFPMPVFPNALWASGADDAWVVANNRVWQHDATGWTERLVANGTVGTIWGTSPTNVYVTYYGGNGQILTHYTGSPTWTPLNPGITNAQAIWGTSATDVYVGSFSDATIAHFNGLLWSPLRTPPPSIGGTQPGEGIRQGVKAPDGKIYVVGGSPIRAFVYDGVGWTSLDAPPGTDRMWVAANGKAFATNRAADKITRFAGSGRISTPSGTTGTTLVANASDDVYTLKNDLGVTYVYHWDGAAWTRDPGLPSASGVTLTPSGTAVAITFNSGLYRRNPNGSWSQYTNVNGLGPLAALDDDDIWVLDTYKVVHWTSGSTAVDFLFDLPGLFPNATFIDYDIWAASPTDIYVVGTSTDISTSVNSMVVLHSNGQPASGWTKQTVPAGARGLRKIYGRSATDIYAISDDGSVLHTTGNGVWTQFSTPPGVMVLDLVGSPTDMFLATSGGLLHSDGTSWTEVSLGSQLNARRVSVAGDGIMAIDGTLGFHEIVRLGPW